jgi:hypothetical protein
VAKTGTDFENAPLMSSRSVINATMKLPNVDAQGPPTRRRGKGEKESGGCATRFLDL